MTKSQLQPGMLAVTRNGNEYLVLPRFLFGINTYGVSLDHYADNLTHAGNDSGIVNPSRDIIAMYTTSADATGNIRDLQLRTRIWQREEHQYPLYFQHVQLAAEGETLIVEFTGLEEGTIVHSDVASFIGTYSDNWKPHTDVANWKQVSNPQPVVEKSTDDGYKYPIYCKNKIYSAFGSTFYEYVVAFTGKTTGTVVYSEIPDIYAIGHTATTWIPHTDDRWELAEPLVPAPPTLEDICKALGVTIREVH